ncbi:RHS repeat domain-containing protein [Flavobacterium sp. HNIBRBA15423]|uniref:RHS repeat domain-containing protein n=1 Tax=Flavobacterium sp. HNIBRBA15423 TaxID=3458683 RepID=UPI004043DB84
MKNINDVENIGNDLFSFKINYNDFESLGDFDDSAIPLYNGNISSTYWKTSSDNILRKYNYSYDVLNRLLEANYLKPTSASTPDNYMEKLSYDKNGNILTLQRNGDRDTDGAQMVNLIDNLEYTYDTNNKNLLVKVDDASNSPQGFKNGSNTGNDYEYDANGNMTIDNNKGITKITYNHLNLPTEITFGTSAKILYLYNATGQKISKVIVDFVGGNSATTHYMSGGFQYKDNYLQFFPHAEGYVSVVDSHGVNNYNYVFNYTDHLGNIRLSYGVDPSTQTIKIMEENHYYAFGLKHTNYNSDQLLYQKGSNETITLKGGTPTIQSTYKYKYNGKELQTELNLNWYDYQARNYDPTLGRWMNIDPLAETSRRWNPYTYVYNNPLRFVDPDGMQGQDVYGLDTESGDITLLEQNDDEKDTLVDNSNQEVISEDVDKGLLYNGQNIMKNGLQTSNYKGGLQLAYDISIYTHDELGGMIYKNTNGENYLDLLPYTHSTIEQDKNGVSMVAGFSHQLSSPFFTSKDGSFKGTISIIFHTHPGHPDFPKLGYAFPSPQDYNVALDNHDINGVKTNQINIYKNIRYLVLGNLTETINGVTSNVGIYQYGKGRSLLNKNVKQLLSD